MIHFTLDSDEHIRPFQALEHIESPSIFTILNCFSSGSEKLNLEVRVVPPGFPGSAGAQELGAKGGNTARPIPNK